MGISRPSHSIGQVSVWDSPRPDFPLAAGHISLDSAQASMVLPHTHTHTPPDDIKVVLRNRDCLCGGLAWGGAFRHSNQCLRRTKSAGSVWHQLPRPCQTHWPVSLTVIPWILTTGLKLRSPPICQHRPSWDPFPAWVNIGHPVWTRRRGQQDPSSDISPLWGVPSCTPSW